MRRSCRIDLALCLAVACSSFAPFALAQERSDPDEPPSETPPSESPPSEVTVLMDEGVRLRRAGDDAGAAEQFRRAHELGAGAIALAQLALAEQALGRWLEAAEHLEAALADEANEWIARHRSTLDESLMTIGDHIGAIEIEGNVPGANIRIDGRDAGVLPLAGPIRVVAGSVVVEGESADHFPVQRVITVSAGRLARVSLAFVPRVVEVEEPPPQARRVRRRAPHPIPMHQTSGPRDWLGPGMIATFSVAAAALAVLIAAVAIKESSVQVWNACDPTAPGGGRAAACADDLARYETAYDWATASGIVGGIAGLMAISFSIVFALAPDGGVSIAPGGVR
jgi:hypothetical protein